MNQVTPISVRRANVFNQVVEIYSIDRNILQTTLEVTFSGERGEDLNGLTREMFTLFWEAAIERFFVGRREARPRVAPYPSNPSPEMWGTLGAIFSHGFVLENYVPYRFTYSTLHYLMPGNIPDSSTVLTSFLSTLSETNDTAITSALRINANSFDENTASRLTAVISHFGSTSLPNPRNLPNILRLVSINQMIHQPFFALHHMRLGMISAHGVLWTLPPSLTSIFRIINSYMPNAEHILNNLDVEYSGGDVQQALENNIVDWFSQFLRSLNALQIMMQLRFITSSNVLNGRLRVRLNGNQNDLNPIQVQTCSQQIVFSRYILSYETIETFLLNIINNPYLWNTFDSI